MNKDQVLEGLYGYLLTNLPAQAIELILLNDIRVENFFSIHTGVYLEILLVAGHIHSYSFQHTILLGNRRRAHIDISFTDTNNIVSYLELKHFSISQNRGNGRRLSFYTSNSPEGKKVGIVSDCEKLDALKNNGLIEEGINLICCAFITHKPTLAELCLMQARLENYAELENWQLSLPVPWEEQNNNLGIITLQK
jgi:hypothetical protein